MFHQKMVSVIIPCHNEEKGLAELLSVKPACVDEWIVVDNDSCDQTVRVAKSRQVNVIYEKNRGYGYACLAGLRAARGDIMITLDGDGSYPLASIPDLLRCMEEESLDFVSGSRFPLADRKAQPLINQWANGFVSALARRLFGICLKDSQSGMMAFKRDLLDRLPVKNTGMGFSQEIKLRVFVRKDVRCGEVHIPYGPRTGETKFRKLEDSLRNICALLCLWYELRN